MSPLGVVVVVVIVDVVVAEARPRLPVRRESWPDKSSPLPPFPPRRLEVDIVPSFCMYGEILEFVHPGFCCFLMGAVMVVVAWEDCFLNGCLAFYLVSGPPLGSAT